MKERSDNWIYGFNPVMESIKSGRAISAIYIYGGRKKDLGIIIKEASQRGLTIKESPMEFFDRTFPKGHQGIAARVQEKEYASIEELLHIPHKKNEPAFFLVLDELEDPRNFGAILRSAEAVGVHGVVIQKHRSAGLSPLVSKASAGAVEYVPVSMLPNIKHAIDEMKENNIYIAGAEGGEGACPWDVDLTVPICLVVGSEGSGLRKTVKDRCDAILSLPMKGKINSLNASVATGILLYEILRQRIRKS